MITSRIKGSAVKGTWQWEAMTWTLFHNLPKRPVTKTKKEAHDIVLTEKFDMHARWHLHIENPLTFGHCGQG